MKVLSQREHTFRLTMEFEFASQAEEMDFVQYVGKFNSPTAIQIERDGHKVAVPFTKAHTKEYQSNKEFVMMFCDGEGGATLNELHVIAQQLGYKIPRGTISGCLSNSFRDGFLKKLGKRPGKGGKLSIVYRTVK